MAEATVAAACRYGRHRLLFVRGGYIPASANAGPAQGRGSLSARPHNCETPSERAVYRDENCSTMVAAKSNAAMRRGLSIPALKGRAFRPFWSSATRKTRKPSIADKGNYQQR